MYLIFASLENIIIDHNTGAYTVVMPSFIIISLHFHMISYTIEKIVSAFQGMHVSHAKHSYAWLPRKCDYRTDTRTDRQTDGRTDRCRTTWSLCAAMLRRRHNKGQNMRYRTVTALSSMFFASHLTHAAVPLRWSDFLYFFPCSLYIMTLLPYPLVAVFCIPSLKGK